MSSRDGEQCARCGVYLRRGIVGIAYHTRLATWGNASRRDCRRGIGLFAVTVLRPQQSSGKGSKPTLFYQPKCPSYAETSPKRLPAPSGTHRHFCRVTWHRLVVAARPSAWSLDLFRAFAHHWGVYKSIASKPRAVRYGFGRDTTRIPAVTIRPYAVYGTVNIPSQGKRGGPSRGKAAREAVIREGEARRARGAGDSALQQGTHLGFELKAGRPWRSSNARKQRKAWRRCFSQCTALVGRGLECRAEI
ncbi:hypothetical protein FB451DRAFT_1178460 [Mycena latifolia]|nr:hypothetical protein FB451DRAFT_1178460 [Mycena latifolia]